MLYELNTVLRTLINLLKLQACYFLLPCSFGLIDTIRCKIKKAIVAQHNKEYTLCQQIVCKLVKLEI